MMSLHAFLQALLVTLRYRMASLNVILDYARTLLFYARSVSLLMMCRWTPPLQSPLAQRTVLLTILVSIIELHFLLYMM